MTKKDYELIAGILNKQKDEIYQASGYDETFRHLTNEFAYQLKLENNRFDQFKFVEACYQTEISKSIKK